MYPYRYGLKIELSRGIIRVLATTELFEYINPLPPELFFSSFSGHSLR